MPNRKQTRLIFAAAVSTLAFLAGVAAAESIWVSSDNVRILAGKGAVFPVVANAPKGTELTVIDREGNWIKVQDGTQQGYVYQNAVSPKQVSGDTNLLANVGAGSDVSTVAAEKGFRPQTLTYAQQKSLDTSLLKQLVDWRTSITPEEWQAFVAQGKVGVNSP